MIKTFKYLRSYFAGAAKKEREFIGSSKENSDRAVNTFSEWFAKRDLIVDRARERPAHCTVCEIICCRAHLPDLYDHIVSRDNSAEGLGIPPEEYEAALRHILLRALIGRSLHLASEENERGGYHAVNGNYYYQQSHRL